ncbi:hypothetical protein FHS43_000572 [Streptosporangium becharense]|uniref:Uncharacterized protein n=1 Tax=Streptosporangium becharense TaxID=1816182 RepID=A0A7W9IND5_9ACTN|nr:hypothetical protein [Streptosporangium becharense]MBB2909326.1 hypothetical protein [Streptosporangium becharense]MBB5823771.1 hypothetical protein [Streptosporangium becharense]
MAFRMTIQGETFETDPNRLALHEGIALQKATGLTAKDLEAGMQNGDFLALAAYVWINLKFRLGKDVSWAQIETGEYEIDLAAIKVERIDEPGPTKAGRARDRAATSKSAG